MSQLLLIVLLLFAADDSPLVKAAKANGGLKKPITKKTITNKDVKKSTGKIIELSAAEGRAEARPPSVTIQEHEANKKAVAAAEARVDNAQAKVDGLEKDLARIEQSYYEAADPQVTTVLGLAATG